jgi:hypothetical protein
MSSFFFVTALVGFRPVGITVGARDWSDAEHVATERIEKSCPVGDVVVTATQALGTESDAIADGGQFIENL